MKILNDKEKQYNTLLKSKKNTNKKYNFLIKLWEIILFFLIVTVVFLAYLQISGVNLSHLKNGLHYRNGGQEEFIASKRNSFQLFNKRRNILLMGEDANSEGGDPFSGTRSDTIIIMNIDPSNKTINAVSIPRDSKVYIAQNNGVQKINSAHAIGGPKLTIKTIENSLGVHIDNYVTISIEGVKKLVDELGGVSVYVDKDLHYHDYAGKLHIDLQKGENLLDGEKAQGYLRFRHDAMGDISRTTRQQWFLKAILAKLQKAETIPKIPKILKIANSYVKTDLSLYEMSHLVALLRNVDDTQIEFATLPGSPSKRGYASYWILDPEKTQEVLGRMIYRTEKKSRLMPEKVAILYTAAKAETAMSLQNILKEENISAEVFVRANLPHSQIIGHNKSVSNEFMKWIKKKEPALKKMQFVYDSQSLYGANEDLTIIISNN